MKSITNIIKIADLVNFNNKIYVVIYKDTHYIYSLKKHAICVGLVEIGKKEGIKYREVIEVKSSNIENLEIISLK